MPTTYTLIASSFPTSGLSFTFSSIPSTYTDLALRFSARGDNGSFVQALQFQINGDTGTNYSRTWIQGDGGGTSSARTSNATEANPGFIIGSGGTASTFAIGELYFPNYLTTTTKSIFGSMAGERANVTAYTQDSANLYRGTSAISSITIIGGGANFVSGCSFYLYGIKNS